MIVVKDVKVLEADEEKIFLEQPHSIKDYTPFVGENGPQKMSDLYVEREEIRGEKFVTPDGRAVVIGWSGKVQEALSLPFKAFRDQNKTIERLHEENSNLRWNNRVLERKKDGLENQYHELFGMFSDVNNQLANIQTMGFWQRLKFLFTRELPDA